MRYIIILIFLLGCSTLSGRRAVVDDQADAGSVKKESDTVSRMQYDQLLAKYEELLRKNRDGEAGKSENDAFEGKKLSELAGTDGTASENSKVELVETVDLFAKKESPPPQEEKISDEFAPNTVTPRSEEMVPQNVDNQIVELNKASHLLQQNRFDEAMSILKELEKVNVLQVQARAKFLIGEVLFLQGSYDLAMQIYEEVIKKYAFSGIVLKALGRLIACAEKLKRGDKQQQYSSMLYDFFEST